jgi:hypothetical protein
MPLIKTDWSVSRDVQDHGKQLSSSADAAQAGAWKLVSNSGHKHEAGFDEELQPETDTNDSDADDSQELDEDEEPIEGEDAEDEEPEEDVSFERGDDAF